MVKKRVDERLFEHCRIVMAHQRELDPVLDDAPILMLRARPNTPLTLQELDKPLELFRPVRHVASLVIDQRSTESAPTCSAHLWCP